MTYAENLWLFFLLLAGIIIIPGLDMAFVIANALTGGRRAGLAATAGIMLGGVIHTIFGFVGVSLIAATVPALFHLLVIAGAGYMIWIGFSLVRSSITFSASDTTRSRSSWIAFRQGTLTCVLNPKAYLFISAVYPQFLRPEYGSLWRQALVMGLLTVVTQLAVYGTLALAASGSRAFLSANRTLTMLVGRGTGALFIGVGILALWHEAAGF